MGRLVFVDGAAGGNRRSLGAFLVLLARWIPFNGYLLSLSLPPYVVDWSEMRPRSSTVVLSGPFPRFMEYLEFGPYKWHMLAIQVSKFVSSESPMMSQQSPTSCQERSSE